MISLMDFVFQGKRKYIKKPIVCFITVINNNNKALYMEFVVRGYNMKKTNDVHKSGVTVQTSEHVSCCGTHQS